jgi:hypothetical protein
MSAQRATIHHLDSRSSEFSNIESAPAEAEAKKVNADGAAVGTSSALWVGPPHFYRKGKLVVLYVRDKEVC